MPPIGGELFSPLKIGSASTHVTAFSFFLNGADKIVLANTAYTTAHQATSSVTWAISSSRARLHVLCTRFSSPGSFRKVAT